MSEEKYPDVIELKLKPAFPVNTRLIIHFTTMKRVKKYIEVPEEIFERLDAGKYVEGSLHRDKKKHHIVFNAHKEDTRSSHKRLPDKLLASLEHGWLKESPKCIKFYLALKKSIGTARIISAMEREQRVAASHLMDREIIDRV